MLEHVLTPPYHPQQLLQSLQLLEVRTAQPQKHSLMQPLPIYPARAPIRTALQTRPCTNPQTAIQPKTTRYTSREGSPLSIQYAVLINLQPVAAIINSTNLQLPTAAAPAAGWSHDLRTAPREHAKSTDNILAQLLAGRLQSLLRCCLCVSPCRCLFGHMHSLHSCHTRC